VPQEGEEIAVGDLIVEDKVLSVGEAPSVAEGLSKSSIARLLSDYNRIIGRFSAVQSWAVRFRSYWL